MNLKSNSSNTLTAYGIGFTIFISSIILWWLFASSLERYDRARFQNERNRILHEISSRVETYINALTQTRSMFYVSEEVTRSEFETYIQHLDLLQKYPGIQGVGFSQHMTFEEVPRVEKKVRQDGISNFKVWPAHPRPEVFSIVYLEPMNWRNQRALGYDMYTHPVRKEAMDRAWATNAAAMTETVKLVQETEKDKQPGFLIYVPVFSPGVELKGNLKEKPLRGFVYSPFRTRDLFNHVMESLHDMNVNVEVYIGKKSQKIFELFPKDVQADEDLKTIDELNFAQMPWKVIITARPNFRQKLTIYLPILIQALGGALSFLVTFNLLRNMAKSEELAQAVTTRDEFLNIASHELKTPITAMKLQFEVALKMIEKGVKEVFDQENVEKRTKGALRQLDRMSKLIEDMLDSSRLSVDGLKMNRRRFNLTESLQEIVDRFSEQLKSEPPLTVHLPQEDIYMTGDEYRLEQAISNLLTNAHKYGGKNPIEISLRLENERALLEVKDQGIGIPEENLDSIFERYERAPTAKNISGLGLGLYISQQIANAHGGKISVKSKVGKGSIFTLELPIDFTPTTS